MYVMRHTWLVLRFRQLYPHTLASPACCSDIPGSRNGGRLYALVSMENNRNNLVLPGRRCFSYATLPVSTENASKKLVLRGQKCSSYATVPVSTENGRKKLVLLGTGWGSYAVLKSVDKRLYDVVVVSPRNHFLFTPLLASTSVGTLEFRSIIEPVRNTKFRQTNHYHMSRAVDLDLEAKVVQCQSAIRPDIQYPLQYDKLVIGVGALTNTFGVPGVEEHACFLKEVSDARRIRNRILDNFELARQPGVSARQREQLLHIVIVGGGPTGVEFGAELYDFVQQDVARLYKLEEQTIHVTLVESHQILGSFDERLRSFAEKKIRQRERFHLIKSSVIEVKADSVMLEDGRLVPCGLVVWSTGLAPRDFTNNVKLVKNNRGQIVTNRHLEVLNSPAGSVYAVGDCADIQDYPLPCTAQVAEKQGRYVASLLNRVTPTETAKPFKFRSLGMLAYIGNYEALTEMGELKLRGFPSWLLWRSAYLTRLGSWRLRLQVPMDWLKTLVYGRDTSRFD